MGKPVNGLKKKRSKLVSITTWFTNGFTWKYIPVEDVDLHPDGDLERDALLWHEGEIGRVLLLVGLEVGLWVELVEEGGVGQVEVGEGDVGRGVVLARAHVEQPVGQVHVHLVAKVFTHFHFSF